MMILTIVKSYADSFDEITNSLLPSGFRDTDHVTVSASASDRRPSNVDLMMGVSKLCELINLNIQ